MLLMSIYIKNVFIRRLLNFWLGPVLFVWLAFSIYTQLVQQPNLGQSINNIRNAFYGADQWKLWAVLGLMLLNWSIEARKFQVLLAGTEKMSWLRAAEATLTGVAFAMNTPNRIGEYGGRILYVHEGNRLKAISLTMIGSLSQLIVTMLMGCGGILFLLYAAHLPEIAIAKLFKPAWLKLLLFVMTTISTVSLLIFFRPGILIRFAEKLTSVDKFLAPVRVLESLHVRKLLRVLCLSAGRYVVFVFQSILMLQFLQVPIDTIMAFWLMSIIYLFLAIVPTIALAEIGIRGKISLLIIGLISSNELGIVAASTGIWLINLVIPALLGSLLILSVKIFDNR